MRRDEGGNRKKNAPKKQKLIYSRPLKKNDDIELLTLILPPLSPSFFPLKNSFARLLLCCEREKERERKGEKRNNIKKWKREPNGKKKGGGGFFCFL